MYRGTTPPITITLPQEYAVSNITTAYLSFAQNGVKKLEKSLSEMQLDTDTNSLSLVLTQEETLAFAPSVISFQLRFLYDGMAYATQTWKTPVEAIIKDGVI